MMQPTGFLRRSTLLVAAALAILVVLPHRTWNFARTHTLAEETAVTRTTFVHRLGFPVEWLDIRTHDWSATRGEQDVHVGEAEVTGFAGLEIAARGDWHGCGTARNTLSYKVMQRAQESLRTDPRASQVVASWTNLAANMAVFAALIGAMTFVSRRRRIGIVDQRRRKGLCINCGYDLTGNVTGVCSECGKGR